MVPTVMLVTTLTPTLVSTTDMPDTMLDTLMPTTARGPLMLSQRLMLMPTTESMVMDWDTTVWATEHTDTDTLTLIMDMPTTARGPLMLSQRPMLMLMPTTATTVMVPGLTTVWATEDTVWDTEATTGDKFSASEVQSRSSKRTSLLVI